MDKSAGRGVLKSPLSSFERCCQNLRQAGSVQGLENSKMIKTHRFRSIFTFFSQFFFQIHQKNVGKPIPGRKSTLGSLRGNKTGKTMFFDRFSSFVAPE